MFDRGWCRRQRDRCGIHLQRPRDRLTRLLVASHAHQPVRRFRDPCADVECQQGRQQPGGEQAAPADVGRRKCAKKRPQQHADRQHRRGQPGQPAALRRRHEFLHQRDIDGVEPGHAKAHEETADHEIYPCPVGRHRHCARREREIEHGRDHDLAAADLVRQPPVEQRTEGSADAGGKQDHARLAVGQVPVLDDEGEHKSDQEEVEEIQHVAERGRERDLPLVRGQLLLPVEKLEHVGTSHGCRPDTGGQAFVVVSEDDDRQVAVSPHTNRRAGRARP